MPGLTRDFGKLPELDRPKSRIAPYVDYLLLLLADPKNNSKVRFTERRRKNPGSKHDERGS